MLDNRVSFFGLGPMGQAIAQRLMANGYQLYIWNRTPEKTITLAEAGAIIKSSEVDAIRSSDIIVCILTDTAALQEVVFDVDWAHEIHGKTLINFGSISPSRSQAVMDAADAHDSHYIEVAAMGSVADVNTGNLQLMVGASEENYARVETLLSVLSSRITYIGEVGDATTIKLALQQLSAAMFTAFSSSIGLVQEQGVSVDLFMDLLRTSPLYAAFYDQKLPRVLSRDYSQSSLPGRHLQRELQLFMEQAEELGINAHTVESIKEIISFSLGRGLSNADFTAIYDVINPPKEEI